ncbi:MAG: SanA protein [Verrucomicrobiales bacterium]|jgi:SanA protein
MRFLSLLLFPFKFYRRHWKLATPLLLAAAIGLPVLCDRHIASVAGGRCHTDLAQVEGRRVALLLGTAREYYGRSNVFYTRRIEAAAALYHAGKVRGILVSGDNGHSDYDEPTDMKEDLVAAGVPAEFITLDYAGFRTRDSLVRATQIFGQTDLIIVTQRFHAERALFIAEEQGIEASAFIAADPVSRVSNTKVRLREVFARSLAVVDALVDTPPKFLGEREQVALSAR